MKEEGEESKGQHHNLGTSACPGRDPGPLLHCTVELRGGEQLPSNWERSSEENPGGPCPQLSAVSMDSVI